MENIWFTMVVGSIGDVGSCDCISVTSSLINVSSALFAAELVELVELLEFVELEALAWAKAGLAIWLGKAGNNMMLSSSLLTFRR
jgi:hypothetical protein